MNVKIVNHEYMRRKYDLTVKWDIFDYGDLIIDIPQVRRWCMEGCPNYNINGGCPPYSPTANDLFKGRDFILLLCKMETCQLSGIEPVSTSKTIDDLICEFMDEKGHYIKDQYNYDFLNSGCCRGCETCTISTGCKNPSKRSYSITGTGILLGKAIENLFGEELEWLTPESSPKHIIKIMAFLPSHKSKIPLIQLCRVMNEIL